LPVIAAGCAFTVTVMLRVHPMPTVLLMVAVPALIPVTAPVPGLTDTVASGLLHTPLGALLNVIVLFSHTHIGEGPVITDGSACTVTVAELLQPVERV